MRTKLPIVAAILGLFLLLAGAAGQWLLKTPAQEAADIALPSEAKTAKALRIPAAAGGSDGFDVTLKGEGPWNVALIRSADSADWIGKSQQVVLSGTREDLSAAAEGSADVPLPSSADSFAKVTELRGESVQHIPAAQKDRMYDVLIMGKDGAQLPSSLSVFRSVQRSQPWGIPLMLLGGLILLGSLIWWLMTRERKKGAESLETLHDDKAVSSEPRTVPITTAPASGAHVAPEPSTAPVPTVPVTTAPATPASNGKSGGSHAAPRSAADRERPRHGLSLAVAALLTGSLAMPAGLPGDVRPAASLPAAAIEGDRTPTLSGPQLEGIVKRISGAVAQADAKQDAKLLEGVTNGPAQTMRSYTYSVRAKNPKAAAPTPLPTRIVTTMVPYSDSFPRSVVAVVQKDDASLPIALVLEQSDAQSNYVLNSTMTMLPGASFPQPSGDTGARALAPEDRGTAQMSGQETMSALSDQLGKTSDKNKSTFESTSFQKDIEDFQSAVLKNTKSAAAAFDHAVDWHHVRVMPLEDGGHMVFGYMRMGYTAAPKDETSTLDLSGTPYEKLVGKTKIKDKLDIGYGESVMVYVPKKGSSAKPIVTGADQTLLYARKH